MYNRDCKLTYFRNLYTTFIFFVGYCVYALIFPELKINYVNVLIVVSCTILIGIGIHNIKKFGITIDSVFILCYFGVLIVNNLNISALQMEKTLMDYYYFFCGPMIFVLILYIVEKLPVKPLRKRLHINANIVASLFFVIYIIMKVYIFHRTGIRLFSNAWSTSQSPSFIIPGISGISSMFMWLTLMMLPDVSNQKLKMTVIFLAILLDGIFPASRGNAMRIVLMAIFLYVYKHGQHVFYRRNLTKCICIVITIFVIFSFWGDIRQEKRGYGTEYNIGLYLGSYLNNDTINWIYSYTALNFDVLKQCFLGREPTYELHALLLPIMRISSGNKTIQTYYDSIYTNGLKGFNASTFLSNFILEFGAFYFVEIVVLGLIVSLLSLWCRWCKLRGGYAYLLMLTAFSFFGNYYLVPFFLYTLLICLSIYSVINFEISSFRWHKTLIIRSIKDE